MRYKVINDIAVSSYNSNKKMETVLYDSLKEAQFYIEGVLLGNPYNTVFINKIDSRLAQYCDWEDLHEGDYYCTGEPMLSIKYGIKYYIRYIYMTIKDDDNKLQVIKFKQEFQVLEVHNSSDKPLYVVRFIPVDNENEELNTENIWQCYCNKEIDLSDESINKEMDKYFKQFHKMIINKED